MKFTDNVCRWTVTYHESWCSLFTRLTAQLHLHVTGPHVATSSHVSSHSSPEQPVFNYLKACGDTSYWSRSRHNPELVTVHGCSGPHSHVSKGQIWVGAVHACLEAVKPDSYYCHHFHDYPERLDAFISCSRKPSRWWLRLHHHMNVGYAESNCWRWLEPSHGCVNFFICG